MSGSDRRAGQSRPRPVTKGLEMEGRAGDRGLRGKDGTCQGVRTAPERPHGGAAPRVWTLSPVLSDGLLSGCLSVAIASCKAGLGFALTITQMLSTCLEEDRRLGKSQHSK